MSANSKARKYDKEFQRGFDSGVEGRKKQSGEVRVQVGPFWDGYQKGVRD